MRRNELEKNDTASILALVEQCSVCSLSLAGGEYPYVVPMNFGVGEADGEVSLYFHGSGGGTKLGLIKKDGRAAFSMYCNEEAEVSDKACASTMRYISVCGSGRIELLEDAAEKIKGLTCIMKQYDKSGRTEFDFDAQAVTKTTVFKLTAEQITGKVNKKPD